jgi:hypothetical protein
LRERFSTHETFIYNELPHPIPSFSNLPDLINSSVSRTESAPSYQELLEENRRLKLERGRRTIQTTNTSGSTPVLNITERFERELFEAVDQSGRTQTVFNESQVIWPSEACVLRLLSYGRSWTSWIHCALHHPTFEVECRQFLRSTPGPSNATTATTADPFWLAIYFSFMSVCVPHPG